MPEFRYYMISKKEVKRFIGKAKVNSFVFYLIEWQDQTKNISWQSTSRMGKMGKFLKNFNDSIINQPLPYIHPQFREDGQKLLEQVDQAPERQKRKWKIQKIVGKRYINGLIHYFMKWQHHSIFTSDWVAQHGLWRLYPQQLKAIKRKIKNHVFPYIDMKSIQQLIDEEKIDFFNNETTFDYENILSKKQILAAKIAKKQEPFLKNELRERRKQQIMDELIQKLLKTVENPNQSLYLKNEFNIKKQQCKLQEMFAREDSNQNQSIQDSRSKSKNRSKLQSFQSNLRKVNKFTELSQQKLTDFIKKKQEQIFFNFETLEKYQNLYFDQSQEQTKEFSTMIKIQHPSQIKTKRKYPKKIVIQKLDLQIGQSEKRVHQQSKNKQNQLQQTNLQDFVDISTKFLKENVYMQQRNTTVTIENNVLNDINSIEQINQKQRAFQQKNTQKNSEIDQIWLNKEQKTIYNSVIQIQEGMKNETQKQVLKQMQLNKNNCDENSNVEAISLINFNSILQEKESSKKSPYLTKQTDYRYFKPQKRRQVKPKLQNFVNHQYKNLNQSHESQRDVLNFSMSDNIKQQTISLFNEINENAIIKNNIQKCKSSLQMEQKSQLRSLQSDRKNQQFVQSYDQSTNQGSRNIIYKKLSKSHHYIEKQSESNSISKVFKKRHLDVKNTSPCSPTIESIILHQTNIKNVIQPHSSKRQNLYRVILKRINKNTQENELSQESMQPIAIKQQRFMLTSELKRDFNDEFIDYLQKQHHLNHGVKGQLSQLITKIDKQGKSNKQLYSSLSVKSCKKEHIQHIILDDD